MRLYKTQVDQRSHCAVSQAQPQQHWHDDCMYSDAASASGYEPLHTHQRRSTAHGRAVDDVIYDRLQQQQRNRAVGCQSRCSSLSSVADIDAVYRCTSADSAADSAQDCGNGGSGLDGAARSDTLGGCSNPRHAADTSCQQAGLTVTLHEGYTRRAQGDDVALAATAGGMQQPHQQLSLIHISEPTRPY